MKHALTVLKKGDIFYNIIFNYIAKAIMKQNENISKILACAMAKHPRLGVASNLNQINNNYLLEKILIRYTQQERALLIYQKYINYL